ncbi:hypothetical protein Tco_0870956, partial [Tanacetum coccineum]
MRVKKLEHKVKSRQPRRRARVVIFDTEEDLEDPSKQGRRIVEIDQNPSISLIQDEGTLWIQEDAEIQGMTSADTEILLNQEEPTELVEDLGSGEKGEKEISTANISASTASATPEVSTVAENLVYIRRSAEKDAEIAKQLQEEFDRARQEQEVVAEVDQAHDIDWSDPAVLRYHALQNRSFFVAEVRKNMCMYLKNQGGYKQSHFKGMSYEDIRLIFERVWDQNHDFVPKDSEIEKEVMKRPGFDFPQKSIKKNDDSQQQAGSSKKISREDSDEDNAKKQKLEDDAEKEELRDSVDVVSRDDIAIDVESLATKYPIARCDGSTQIGIRKDYNLISWRLFDSCGIHILLTHTGIAIHMMIEKKYPLTQEMLTRMLSRRLEVDQESEMAFELL